MFATIFCKAVALAGPAPWQWTAAMLLLDLTLAALTRDPFFVVCAAQGAGWLE